MTESVKHTVVGYTTGDGDDGPMMSLTLSAQARTTTNGINKPAGQRFTLDFPNPTESDREALAKGATVTLTPTITKA